MFYPSSEVNFSLWSIFKNNRHHTPVPPQEDSPFRFVLLALIISIISITSKSNFMETFVETLKMKIEKETFFFYYCLIYFNKDQVV